MFRNQKHLPSLPVPDLNSTLQKYLKSVKALVSPTDHLKTQSIVNDFLKNEGPTLQERLLLHKAEMEKKGRSWFIDWWNDYAYLTYRDSVVINVSYFFHFRDVRLNVTSTRRAAGIIASTLAFREQVINETLEPDMAGRGPNAYPLCMEQYRFMVCL